MTHSIALRRVSHTAPRPFFARLVAWHALARQRIALLSLDDHRLKDIGLTREMVEKEANRPFWDTPPN